MAIRDELMLAWADHVGSAQGADYDTDQRPGAPAPIERAEEYVSAQVRRIEAARQRHGGWPGLARHGVDRAREFEATVEPGQLQKLTRHLTTAVASLLVLGLAGALGLPGAALAGGPDHPMAQRPSGLPEVDGRKLALGAAVLGSAPAPSAPAPAALPPIEPVVPGARGALPVGKGMWIWLPQRVEGGNPEATIIRAQEMGLSHLYVRTGSSKSGFYAQQYLNDILPRAHAAGIRIYGWDFPYLFDPAADVARSMEAIRYTTPDGHRIDGFAPDIETRGEGVNIGAPQAAAYTHGLRAAAGGAYPLIAVVPRPNPALVTYPFAEVIAPFDAVAPMVYWMNRDPGSDVAGAIANLSQYGKPVIPIGQAYDGSAEGGPMGVPSRGQIQRFMQVAEEFGATSVSFWSWQHANGEAWDAIRDSPAFTLPATPVGHPVAFTPGQIRAYQSLLNGLGFPVSVDGMWGPGTVSALQAYQAAARVPQTGVVDHLTRRILLTPFGAPIG